MTTYIVLRREDDDGKDIGDTLAWTVVGRYDATTPNGAIRKIAFNLIEGKAGTFVAVPQRSWKPVTVEAVQTTVLRLS